MGCRAMCSNVQQEVACTACNSKQHNVYLALTPVLTSRAQHRVHSRLKNPSWQTSREGAPIVEPPASGSDTRRGSPTSSSAPPSGVG